MSTMTAKVFQSTQDLQGTPINPYHEEPDKIRLSADVSTAHRRQIGSVVPDRGILSDCLTAFIFSIVHDIEAHNLNHYSPDNERKLRQLIARRTSLELNTTTDGGNVTRRPARPSKKTARSVSKRATTKKTSGR